MITHYLKIAFRNLLKYKMQTAISVVGLAVGLCCFCVCFYISRFIGGVDTCFEHRDRIADIDLVTPEGQTVSGVPARLLPTLRERSWAGVEDVTLMSFARPNEYNIIGANDEVLPYTLTSMEVDSLYKKVFTPTVLAGSWEQASGNRNSIVLCRHTAQKLFKGVNDAIGKQVLSPNNRFTQSTIIFTVQAVIEDLPENSSMNFMRTVDMLTLNNEDGYEKAITVDGMTGYDLYVLLNANYTAKQLEQSFQDKGFTFSIFGEEASVHAKPLGKDHDFMQEGRMMSLVTSLVGLLILLVASLNFFHFQTGSFLNRGREFGVRRILGNSVSGLFGMQFVQIAVVILLATLISGCMIELASPLLSIKLFRFAIEIPKEVLLVHLMQYMGGLLVITALVALSIAFHVHRATLQTTLRGYAKVNGKKRLRNILLGIQFFICWLFVAMTTALYLQSEKTSSAMFDTLTRQEKREIIQLPLNYKFLKAEDRQIIISKIREHTGVKEILFTDIRLVPDRMERIFESYKPRKFYDVRIMKASSNYADFMNIGMEGIAPQKSDEIVITRNLQSQIEGDAIGKNLYYSNRQSFTITGVIDNMTNYVYNDGYGKASYGTVIFYIDGYEEGDYLHVKCHPGKYKEVSKWIEQTLRDILPSSVEPKICSMEKAIEESQALENKLKGIILFFSIVCLVITLLGVYSAITLDTERRQKEVAIRKVNGAGLKEIILLFARLYLWLLGISAGLAFPLIYLILQAWKEMYLVFFNDGILYWGGILLGVSGITALTVIFRILKIARINPAKIIKSE